MAPRSQRTCVVCQHHPSKYTCVSCKANYCSVTCYTQHKEACPARSKDTSDVPFVDIQPEQPAPVPASQNEDKDKDKETDDGDVSEPLQDPKPLRPLTSLQWPYVPDTSAYPDPLTRDDPKPLQMHQYEALATSSTVRAMLASNPRLCQILTSINELRGSEREEALQRALGVNSRQLKNDDSSVPLDEDTKALRAFAEAVEVAVRNGREDVLGLDWD